MDTDRPAAHTPAWWPRVRQIASAVFLALVLVLIVRESRSIHWHDVRQTLAAYPLSTLLGVAGLGLLSHLLDASFDVLSRRYAGHTLSTPRVLLTSLISYAFNLNFGALLGGLAFRVRLYTRQGLSPLMISRVYGFSMLTNWVGYLTLAGGLLWLQPLSLPAHWPVGPLTLRVLGSLLLLLVVVYVGLCCLSPRRSVTLRGHTLQLPSGGMAVAQLLMSCTNWALIGGVVYLLLAPQVHYPAALSTLLTAAVAGVVTHVPAGLGVFEAVYSALLSPPLSQHQLLAALIVYRALYYLLPLAVASVLLLLFEWRLRHEGAPAPADVRGAVPPSRAADPRGA